MKVRRAPYRPLLGRVKESELGETHRTFKWREFWRERKAGVGRSATVKRTGRCAHAGLLSPDIQARVRTAGFGRFETADAKHKTEPADGMATVVSAA